MIIPSPFFTSYDAEVMLCGGRPVTVALRPEHGMRVNAADIEAAITPRTRAVIINSPGNPTGAVTSAAELARIAEVCKQHNIWAISDEVYHPFVFGETFGETLGGEAAVAPSIAAVPGMKDRTIVVESLSKTYAMTGWRLGYAIAPKPIMDRIKQYHDFNTVGAPSPLMEAAVVGLDMPDSYYKEFGDHYAHMKKLFTDGLKQIGIPFTDPQGAYFVLADIGPYLRKGESDVDFCLEMAEKVGVACVPGTSFFNENVNNIVRVHFAKKDETLYEALDRLSHLKEKMR